MRSSAVRIGDVIADGYRLTGAFHLSEDEIAFRALRANAKTSSPLLEVTTGRRVFKGPMFRRRYVEDPTHGEPYVSPNDLDRVFVEPAGYLSKRLGGLLDELRLREGMILVTRSGMSLGKALWTRGDMSGLVASDDLIRIEVDANQIPAGYLYVFLSSRYGRVAIRRQTYGGSVKHIEPQHLYKLPIPRLNATVEGRIHELALSSSAKVSRHVALMREATSTLLARIGLSDPSSYDWSIDDRRLGWEECNVSSLSMRAMNYDPRAIRLREAVAKHSRVTPLGSLCDPEWFKGQIVFTRIDSDPEHGALLLGQRKAFRPRPEGRWISRRSIKGLGLQVPAGTTLIPSHGTLGENELYCRSLYVTPRASKYAFSGDFYRCIPVSGEIHPGYLHAFLRSEVAFRLLRSLSAGSKQQYQHPVMMWNFPIPRLDGSEEDRIGALVDAAADEIDAAMSDEDEAERLFEKSLLEVR